MRRRRSNNGLARAAALALSLAPVAARAQAAPPAGQGYAADNLSPAERGSDFFAADSLDLRGHGRISAGLTLTTAYRTVADRREDGGVNASPVRNQALLYPSASLVLFDRVRVGLQIPLAVYGDGNQAVMPVTSGPAQGPLGVYPATTGPALGDLRIGLDARLVGAYRDPFTLALGAQLFAPTGSRAAYTGDGSARALPRVAVAGQVGFFQYAASLGVHLRARDDATQGRAYGYGGRVGHEVVAQVAVGARLAGGRVVFGPELHGRKAFDDDLGAEKGQSSPVEVLFGGRVGLTRALRLGAGVGAGLTTSYGAPVARGVFALEWVPALPVD